MCDVARSSSDPKIFDDLVEFGYSTIELEDVDLIDECFQKIPSFLEDETVKSTKYDEFLEFGFLTNPPVKSFFAIKVGHEASALMWPRNPLLKSICNDVFMSLNRQARTVCDTITRAANVDASWLLEELPCGPGEISHSFMHLFQYNPQSDEDLSQRYVQCGAHTDSGLVTLIPQPPTESGLWVMHPESGEWQSVEKRRKQQGKDDEEEARRRRGVLCTVIAGETMHALTEGRVKASVHRVKTLSGEERRSIPFQLRADALALSRLQIVKK